MRNAQFFSVVRALPLREVFRASHATFLRLFSTAMTLVFGIIGVRLLGSGTFGEYVSLFTIAGLLSVVMSLGLPTLVQREIAASRGSGDQSSFAPIGQFSFMIIVIGLLSFAIFVLLGHFVISILILFSLLSFFCAVTSAMVIASERVLLSCWLNDAVKPGVALLTLIGLSFVTLPSSLLPLYSQLLGVLLAVFILLYFASPILADLSKLSLQTSRWSPKHGQVLRAGAVFAGVQILINLTTQLDILILTFMASPEDLAHYYAAARAAIVINFFFAASGMLTEPEITRLYAADDTQRAKKAVRSTLITGVVVTVIAAIMAALLAPTYLSLYGPEFLMAYNSFLVFAAGLVVRSWFGPCAPVLRAIRAEGVLLGTTAVALSINAALSLTLVPFLGILGAAIGTAVQFIVYGALMAIMVHHRSGIRTDLFQFVK